MPLAPCLFRPGFTFIEVLFAIIILGVGLIMIAGMLPVAIQQGQKSQEDLNGRIACDNGYAIVRAVLNQDGANALLAPTPSTSATPSMKYGPATSATLFNTLIEDRISRVDPRFQWVPFYQREAGSNRVNLIVIAARRVSSDIGPDGERYWPNFIAAADNGPQDATANFVDGESSNCNARLSSAGIAAGTISTRNPVTDYVIFDTFTNADAEDAPAEGAFVIISETPTANDPARNNGRIFRIGQQVQAGNKLVWTLDPAYDLAALATGADTSLEDTGRKSDVYVLGRGLRNPSTLSSGTNPYVGPAQDVAVERYSFTIR